jgi:hypothetical protein
MEFISQDQITCDLIHECGEEIDGMVEILKNLKNKHGQDKESETYKMIEKAIIDLTNVTITENGDKAYKSSMNALVDLYYKSLRNVDENELRTLFQAAYKENAYLTRRMIAYIRDIRGGKGERFIGKVLLEELAAADINALRSNALKYFDTYGRWDDGVLFDKVQYEEDKRNDRNRVYEEQQLRKKLKENLQKKNKKNAFELLNLDEKNVENEVTIYKKYSEQLLDVYVETVVSQLYNDIESMNNGKSISLCAKWVPSEKGAHGYVYKKIAKAYGVFVQQNNGIKCINCGDFRKQVLSPLRAKLNILETKLCNKDYKHIDYEQVPSVAMNKHSKAPSVKGKKYQKNSANAFMRNDKERFMEYKNKVVKGEAKVNVSALFPHQIVQHYYNPENHRQSHTMDDLVEGQWKTMVEEMSKIGDLSESLVLADVSGSMDGMPMLISYTMGILISSIAKCEVWKDVVLTFESQPRLVKIKGETLYEKVKSIAKAPWGGDTNFMAAMNVILEMAIKYKLNQTDLPKRLIVVSDMQFNTADHSANNGSFEVVKKKFETAGYTLPQMVFWNVRSTNTVPVMSGIPGVSLVSGYSPNVLKSVLYSTTVTPEETMMNAIMDTRYDLIN